MGIGTGIAVAAGIGAAGSLASGMMQSSAAEDAANAQLAGTQASNKLQWDMFQQNRADMEPWRNAGGAAIGRISRGIQPGGEFSAFRLTDFNKDPGYEWRKQQGIDAVRAGGSATGAFGSGNMAVALENLGQNMASQEYGAAYARWLDQYNKVATVAGMGQQQSQAIGALGANTANVMGQNTMAGANAQAQGIIGSANAWGNAFQNMNNQAMGGMGMWMNYQNQQNLINAFGMSGGNAYAANEAATSPYSAGYYNPAFNYYEGF